MILQPESERRRTMPHRTTKYLITLSPSPKEVNKVE